MTRRACQKCREVKDIREFPPIAGAPLCRACVGNPPEDRTPPLGGGSPTEAPAPAGTEAGGEPPTAPSGLPTDPGSWSGDAARAPIDADPPAASAVLLEAAVNRRDYQRAMSKAKTRLVQRHREEFDKLLAEERKGEA